MQYSRPYWSVLCVPCCYSIPSNCDTCYIVLLGESYPPNKSMPLKFRRSPPTFAFRQVAYSFSCWKVQAVKTISWLTLHCTTHLQFVFVFVPYWHVQALLLMLMWCFPLPLIHIRPNCLTLLFCPFNFGTKHNPRRILPTQSVVSLKCLKSYHTMA